MTTARLGQKLLLDHGSPVCASQRISWTASMKKALKLLIGNTRHSIAPMINRFQNGTTRSTRLAETFENQDMEMKTHKLFLHQPLRPTASMLSGTQVMYYASAEMD